MADDDKKKAEIKKELLAKAKKDRKITQQDIFAAIPETPANADILDELYTALADANISVVAPNEPAVVLSDDWAEEEEEEEVAA